MIERYDSVVVDVVTRLMVPVIQLFGLYVIFHGHYSPGGGFQGGVILAASIILLRLTLGTAESYRHFSPRLALVLACAGIFAFALTGIWPMFTGGEMLNYGEMLLPIADAPARRYFGILLVELAIGVAVWGALVAIYDMLSRSVA